MRSVIVATIAVSVAHLAAQAPGPALVGPFTDAPKFHAPFTADATTVIDYAGTRQEMNARYFRDSNGRVRVEYADGAEHSISLIVPNPYATRDRFYVVDDTQRTLTLGAYGTFGGLFNAAASFGVATGAMRFDLYGTGDVHQGNGYTQEIGQAVIEGLKVIGLRLTASSSGATDERWESPDLALTIAAQHVDQEKRLEISYRLHNIRTGEPPSRLFVMPPDYQPPQPTGGISFQVGYPTRRPPR